MKYKLTRHKDSTICISIDDVIALTIKARFGKDVRAWLLDIKNRFIELEQDTKIGDNKSPVVPAQDARALTTVDSTRSNDAGFATYKGAK